MRNDCIYAIRKFDMKGIWKQPRMPIYLSKKIVVSPDVQMVIVKDLNENPESIKAVISNMKEQDMIFMLSEAIRTVEESGSSAQEAWMICFQERILELEDVFANAGM